MTEPNETVKNDFRIGVEARQWVLKERAELSERSGLDIRHCTSVCPICGKGHLVWTVMPNEHIHMHCTTENCVSWIE